VFRRRRLVAEQKRAIDHLNVDAAILDGFKGLRVFEQGARPWRVAEGRASAYFLGAELRFLIRREWHNAANAVMPVGDAAGPRP